MADIHLYLSTVVSSNDELREKEKEEEGIDAQSISN